MKINKKGLSLCITTFLLVSPVLVLAQNCPPGQVPPCPNIVPIPGGLQFYQLVTNIAFNLIDVLGIAASGFVIIAFVLAGFKYLTAKGEPGKIAEANQSVIWGLAGVAVLVIAFSTGLIVTLVQNSLF